MKIQHLRNGVILVCIGLVFLFNNLGYVDWEVWETILSWWPIYLIALGIEIVFRNSKLKLVAIISPLTFAFFILGPAWWQWEGKEEDRLVQESRWSEEILPETNLLQADLDFHLGNLTIAQAADKKVNCRLEYEGTQPVWDFSQKEGSAKLAIQDRSQKTFGITFGSAGFSQADFRGWDRKEWQVELDGSTPLELKLSSQVSKNDLDLSKLRLKSLELCLQVAKANIRLGEKSDTIRVNLEQDLSKVNLWVPKESAIQLQKDVDLGGISYSHLNIVKADQVEAETGLTGHPVIHLTYQGALCKLNIRGY